MEQEYMVALVAIEDGHPEYGPFPITANNALNAVEIAFRFHHFPASIINTVVAVQLPDSNVAITFNFGTVGF